MNAGGGEDRIAVLRVGAHARCALDDAAGGPLGSAIAIAGAAAIAEPADVLDIDAACGYDLLAGAGNLLAPAVVVIVTLPYVAREPGERSLGDALALLGPAGFRFAGARDDTEAPRYAAPIGFHGNDARIAGRMLFVRDIERVAADPLALRKLAFVAFALGQTAYGWTAVERLIERHGRTFGTSAYGRFLAALHAAVERTPSLRPCSFTDLYSVDESYARSDPARRRAVEAQVMARGREIVGAAVAHPGVVALLDHRDTPVEAIFRAYGLDAEAGRLNARRRDDLTRYFAALGCVVNVEPARSNA